MKLLDAKLAEGFGDGAAVHQGGDGVGLPVVQVLLGLVAGVAQSVDVEAGQQILIGGVVEGGLKGGGQGVNGSLVGADLYKD